MTGSPILYHGVRYTAKQKEVALLDLDRMREIARADMMQRVGYVSRVVEPKRIGAVCRGRQACVIGSLWLAHGVKFSVCDGWLLPGVTQDYRADFVATRPSLRLSLDALNVAATDWMDLNEFPGNSVFTDPVEALFESEEWATRYADDGETDDDENVRRERRRVMLKVIAAAKRKIKAAV